jgi:hypothetical protein
MKDIVSKIRSEKDQRVINQEPGVPISDRGCSPMRSGGKL